MLVDMTEQAGRTRQRRRGEELEAAILEAAWGELVDVGFAKLTMESVAARAKTGVAVLYRRWPRKDDLVLDAIQHYGVTHPVGIPDTGNLRDGMIALLSGFSSVRVSFVDGRQRRVPRPAGQQRPHPGPGAEKLIADRPLWSSEIYRRAHERGEIDLDRVPQVVLSMPFDLMRHDMLIMYQPIPPERVLEIVDYSFMPRIAAASHQP